MGHNPGEEAQVERECRIRVQGCLRSRLWKPATPTGAWKSAGRGALRPSLPLSAFLPDWVLCAPVTWWLFDFVPRSELRFPGEDLIFPAWMKCLLRAFSVAGVEGETLTRFVGQQGETYEEKIDISTQTGVIVPFCRQENTLKDVQ